MSGTIGKTLKDLIKKSGHTIAEEAEAIGVAQSTLSDIINGKREIRSGTIKMLCEHFDISSDYLLGLSSSPKINAELAGACDYSGLNYEAMELLHSLTEETKPIILNDPKLNSRLR